METPELGLFIRLMHKTGDIIQSFVVGFEDKNGFTGLIGDYTGAGNYEDRLVIRNEFIPNFGEDECSIEDDEIIELFDKISPVSREDLITELHKFAEFDYGLGIYMIKENAKELLSSERTIYSGKIFKKIPYGVGVTYFDDGNRIEDSKLDFDKYKDGI